MGLRFQTRLRMRSQVIHRGQTVPFSEMSNDCIAYALKQSMNRTLKGNQLRQKNEPRR